MLVRTTPLRSPSIVMKLSRLGAFHQTRLSFVRSLIRTMMAEAWHIRTARWEIDDKGFGTAIYHVTATEGEAYSLVLFSSDLPDELRTDRVIAERWDVAFALCEGTVTDDQIELLREELPKQEAGAYLPFVLVISRANKSTRNFENVVNALANGQQPDVDQLAQVGYLFRTTAVYGNGKFGIADFHKLETIRSFKATFRAQMFTVYMLRHFSIMLVNDLAQRRNPAAAVALHPEIARYLGVGNATGLGMAPFLANHPKLIHQWIFVQEKALGRVLKYGKVTRSHVENFKRLLRRAIRHVGEIETVHELQQAKNRQMLTEAEALEHFLDPDNVALWQALLDHGRDWHPETQELIVSLLIELYPELVDELADEMNSPDAFELDPTMTLDELNSLIRRNYSWALDIDFEQPENQHFFWYRSAEKEEPRLGQRFQDPGVEKEQWLTIGRDVSRLYRDLQTGDDESGARHRPVIEFLFDKPIHRGLIRRIQTLAKAPYGEIHDNLLSADCRPIDLLRCKLSFFGASKFDPRSNLWVRITLFQGAPLVEEIGLTLPYVDDWFWPAAPREVA